MSNEKSRYKETMGLSDQTTMVHIYADEDDAQDWKDEAKDNNFSSRSKYLYHLIQEARAYRQHEIGRDKPNNALRHLRRRSNASNSNLNVNGREAAK